MSAELDALFDRTKSLAAKPRTVSELSGGLTNRNYKVTTPDGTFVARVSSAGSELLAIDRDCEYRNSVTAAAAGAGAPVVEYRPQDRLLVIGYIEGRTLDGADVAAAGNITRIAEACRRLHAGGRFGNDFDMFDVQRRYRSVAQSRGFRIPAGYDDVAPQFSAAARALAARPARTVPCHNDLLAANFIDDGDWIWLVDYELSGNNDACFELGNIAAESHLSAEALAGLVTAYYARPRRSMIARAELLGLVGRYGWTLWGAIQHAGSPIDFDFWSWSGRTSSRRPASSTERDKDHITRRMPPGAHASLVDVTSAFAVYGVMGPGRATCCPGSPAVTSATRPSRSARAGAWGETVGGCVGLAYIRHPDGDVLTPDLVRVGHYQVNVGGQLYPATVYLRPPFDPAGHRIKGRYQDGP